jgi:hypothetical protein
MKRAAFVLLLLILPLARAFAMPPPFITTGVAGWVDDGAPGSPLRLAPTVAIDGTHGVLVAGTLLSSSQMGTPYRGARLAGGWLIGPSRHLPIELKARAFHSSGPSDPDQGLVRVEARLHFASPGGGAWMAIAKEQPYGFNGQVAQPLIGLGTWARRGGLSMMLDLEQRSGLFPRASNPDSVRRAGGLADAAMPAVPQEVMGVGLTSTMATVHWDRGRLSLESVGGVTLSLAKSPRRWAVGTAALQVTRDFTVFATVGNRDPELYLIEPSDSPRTSVGFRLSQWRSAALDAPLVSRASVAHWTVRRLEGESWTLAVRAPGARLVEVSGDFTDWEPLRLDHVGGDRWQAVVALVPGVHQVNLRVDGGAWLPPPGAPTTADGFGGRVGVVVAE